jgi:3-hydroxybutyryl-CoA dehydrogenase
LAIKTVGVIGAGIMGSGIIQVCAQSGYETRALEVNEQLLNKGLDAMKKFLAKSVEKGKMQQADVDALLAKVHGTTNIEDFKDCDLVIEAATENMEIKKKIFADLDRICPPDAILSTNSSCLSILDIAMVTKRPDKVLGLHFFNPVPIMRLLELVVTIVTSEETLSVSREVGKKLGKTVIVAKDAPAYIVNRLLMPHLIEAIRLYEVDYATKEDIDNGAKLGLNYPMGPLELLDFVGIDTAYSICVAMYDELKDPKFAPPLLMKKMVIAGLLGRKTGKGFYDYSK